MSATTSSALPRRVTTAFSAIVGAQARALVIERQAAVDAGDDDLLHAAARAQEAFRDQATILLSSVSLSAIPSALTPIDRVLNLVRAMESSLPSGGEALAPEVAQRVARYADAIAEAVDALALGTRSAGEEIAGWNAAFRVAADRLDKAVGAFVREADLQKIEAAIEAKRKEVDAAVDQIVASATKIGDRLSDLATGALTFINTSRNTSQQKPAENEKAAGPKATKPLAMATAGAARRSIFDDADDGDDGEPVSAKRGQHAKSIFGDEDAEDPAERENEPRSIFDDDDDDGAAAAKTAGKKPKRKSIFDDEDEGGDVQPEPKKPGEAAKPVKPGKKEPAPKPLTPEERKRLEELERKAREEGGKALQGIKGTKEAAGDLGDTYARLAQHNDELAALYQELARHKATLAWARAVAGQGHSLGEAAARSAVELDAAADGWEELAAAMRAAARTLSDGAEMADFWSRWNRLARVQITPLQAASQSVQAAIAGGRSLIAL